MLAFAAAARLALHRGDLKEAERQLDESDASTADVLVRACRGSRCGSRLHLARAYVAIGDQSTARHLLREIDDILLHGPRSAPSTTRCRGLRELLTSESPAGATGASPLSPAELRLLPYLQTHLTFREIGERLFVSRNTISSEVGSIYRKLGVSSRSDAVQQAMAVGLLGG